MEDKWEALYRLLSLGSSGYPRGSDKDDGYNLGFWILRAIFAILLAIFVIDTYTAQIRGLEMRQKMRQEMMLFNKTKLAIEGHLRELLEIADRLDRVNKNSAIAKTAGSSFGALEGVLTIAGIALAPATAGASIAMATATIGFSLAGLFTSVCSEMEQECNKMVTKLLSKIEREMTQLGKSYNNVHQVLSDFNEKKYIYQIFIYNIYKLAFQSYEAYREGAELLKTFKTFTAGSVVKQDTVGYGPKNAGVLTARKKMFRILAAGISVYNHISEIPLNYKAIYKGSGRAKQICMLVKRVQLDLVEQELFFSEMKKVV